jgi:hypothetical protein
MLVCMEGVFSQTLVESQLLSRAWRAAISDGNRPIPHGVPVRGTASPKLCVVGTLVALAAAPEGVLGYFHAGKVELGRR